MAKIDSQTQIRLLYNCDMINRKIVLGTTISGLLVIVTVVAVTGQFVKSQTPTSTTTIVNFTQLFKEKLNDPYLTTDASVIYQSPTTVVLEGNKLTVGAGGFVDNQYLWQAVDLVKQQGYNIDSVTMSGVGTADNPDVYHVILSHK